MALPLLLMIMIKAAHLPNWIIRIIEASVRHRRCIKIRVLICNKFKNRVSLKGNEEGSYYLIIIY